MSGNEGLSNFGVDMIGKKMKRLTHLTLNDLTHITDVALTGSADRQVCMNVHGWGVIGSG